MSYDITHADRKFNYTYNVAKMWYASKPEKGIRCFYGMNGKDALKEQRDIRDYMELNRPEMLEFEPENGWGDYQGALDFVNRLIASSLAGPDDIWDGD